LSRSQFPKTTWEPSLKIAFMDTILSGNPIAYRVVPDELFPTIPPIMQRLEVEVLGQKTNHEALNTSSTHPELL
jgi:hypothetical protein